MSDNSFETTMKCEIITVEVERFQPMLGAGPCVAFVKVKFKTPIGSISIDNFRLLKGKTGGLFVAPPSHKKGERFYDDVIVTEDLNKLLNWVIKKAHQDQEA